MWSLRELYRYTGNDPVNQVDPSGLAVLIPTNDLATRNEAVSLTPCSQRSQFLFQQFQMALDAPAGADRDAFLGE